MNIYVPNKYEGTSLKFFSTCPLDHKILPALGLHGHSFLAPCFVLYMTSLFCAIKYCSFFWKFLLLIVIKNSLFVSSSADILEVVVGLPFLSFLNSFCLLFSIIRIFLKNYSIFLVSPLHTFFLLYMLLLTIISTIFMIGVYTPNSRN